MTRIPDALSSLEISVNSCPASDQPVRSGVESMAVETPTAPSRREYVSVAKSYVLPPTVICAVPILVLVSTLPG